MGFLKGSFYTLCGALFVLFYREGHSVLMNWTAIIWMVGLSWELAKAMTPYKKSANRWHD